MLRLGTDVLSEFTSMPIFITSGNVRKPEVFFYVFKEYSDEVATLVLKIYTQNFKVSSAKN